MYTCHRIETKDSDAEAKRKARVDAIWAEMNKKEEPKRRALVQDTTKQPLDDISATLNDNKDKPSSLDKRFVLCIVVSVTKLTLCFVCLFVIVKTLQR